MHCITLLLLLSGLVLVSSACATAGAFSDTHGFDAELHGFAYPFPVHEFRFESQRQILRMRYIDEPPQVGNGRTVLLLHGKNFAAAYWAPTIRALTAKGYRVIAPDQIGFGKSSKPQAYQFSFAQLASNTNALLDAANVGRVIVVGHSMGGMLATQFTLQYPQRVERLALVDPIGLEDYGALVPYPTIDKLYQEELKATPESLREYERQSYYAGQWKPEYEALLAPQAGWTQNRDYPKVAWDAALTTDMILNQPVVYDFPRIQVPTLLIIGLRDRTALGKAWAKPEVAAKMGNYPELGKATARAIPNARLVELPGIGHLPQVEAFDQYIAALTAFIDQGGPAR